MFHYETDRPRCWRPDLVPAIMKWLDSLPPVALAALRGVDVELMGAFSARFLVPNDRGVYREVTHRFDHTGHDIITDVGVWGSEAAGPVPFRLSQLTTPANTR